MGRGESATSAMTLFDETAAKLLARRFAPALRTGVDEIDRHSGLFPGQVLEVSGPHASGKTGLLMQIALQCILPKRLGGLESVAVFVDLDGKFDSRMFISALEKRVQDASWIDVAEAKKSCLERLQYMHCPSSFDFLSLLKILPRLLSKKKLPARVACLIIDNIMAHCWSDKATEIGRIDLQDMPMSFGRVQQSAFAEIERILESMEIFVVVSKYTATEMRRDSRGRHVWDQRELVQHRLQKLYSQRLILVAAKNLPNDVQRFWNLKTSSTLAKWMHSESPPFKLELFLQN